MVGLVSTSLYDQSFGVHYLFIMVCVLFYCYLRNSMISYCSSGVILRNRDETKFVPKQSTTIYKTRIESILLCDVLQIIYVKV